MRTAVIASVVGISAAIFTLGCEVHEHDRGPEATVGVGVDADVETAGPVFSDPGVVAIDVDPSPDQREYVYDPGFPPGVYLYDNYYYYGGYRYPHDVFVNQYVQENIRRGQYTNREENRTRGQQIEQRQRTEFTKTGGHHVAANRAPANRTDVNRTENRTDVNRAERPAERSANQPARTNDPREEHSAVNPPQRPNEQRPATPREEQRPTVKPEERPATPREEQHPAVKPEERTAESRKESPTATHEPAKAGEKPEHEEQK